MSLFKGKASSAREPEATIRPTMTLDGLPQHEPEERGGAWARRQRLFEYAKDRLSGHPLSSGNAFGRPLGDGYGMQELVGTIEPIFSKERSLIRWVAIRGALPMVWQCGPQNWEKFSESVGLRYQDDLPSGEGRWVIANRPADLTSQAEDAALGLHASIMTKVSDYGEIENWDVPKVNADVFVNEAIGLDYIAWVSAALLRLEAQHILPPAERKPAPPSAMEVPGWYVDPLFTRSDRYWNGTDWTASCRVMLDRKWHATELPLK
jgi:hypothetical protein